ncbi:xanthine dehydrogenase family protein molybdopterin-binding subunit [Mesorhizobium sp. B2-4-9]|uniref:xanthine dehydrogenase family protein molybdopterin-binding subunit n=1 Tax=Mesorhizobium sp. B2-4-9 TaxID=2589940 RepID=UPI00112955B0|nr:xanthine dehydrogenase family protein molybdopterin-binding subunit [Mesorhizobium sp. B2-4-9]TPL23454.1 xanthine dehydrogenase family protein molybdopterin-binding subunit [Mesorhizobium sp. B2-4-9]
MIKKSGVSASVPRKEDVRFLAGKGQYVADFFIPGVQEVAFVRSPLAHARIRAIHVPEHLRDVVFTAKDLEGVKPIFAATALPKFKHSHEPILAFEKVRYVGEIIAMCVAKTRAEAEDIVAQVMVDFDELAAVTDMVAARDAGSALVHDHWGDNVFIEINVDGDIAAIAATAPIKVTYDIRTARQCMFPMEGRGVVAYVDGRLGYLTVVTATQMPHIVQTGLAECLGISESEIRIISPDVGGGFGYKGLLLREEVALAWLARSKGIAGRWLEDCREHLSANADCREHMYHITGYADLEGHLLALDCTASVDAGAYSVYPTSAALEASQIANLLPGPYDFKVYRCRSAAVASNKPPILPYRGVARPGVCLAIEAVMDAIAWETGLEPYEVRLRNLVRADQMPYLNVVNKLFDSGDYPECMRQAAEAIGVAKIRKRQQQGESDGRLIGVGVSFFCEQGALGTDVLSGWGRPVVPGYEQASARLTANGHLEIRVGTHSHGQGHETTYAQIAHEILGVELGKIKILQGDTLYSPFSTGTYASRSIVMGGGAVAQASRDLGERIKRIGAWLMQAEAADVKIEDGLVIKDNASVSMREIANAWYLQPQQLPPDVNAGGLEVTSGYRAGRDSGTFSYAAHAVVAAVDPDTGVVELLDYVVVEDGGVLINPMIVDGQIVGGTAQGIGQCLYEAMPYDVQGQPLASTLLDYILPGASEVPDVRLFHMETPSPHTEFGVKGIGEGGAVGPPAAIVSAVNDALRPLGVEVHDLPLKPDVILDAILEARQRLKAKVA